MTAQELRDTLPDVSVAYRGMFWRGKLSGRKLPFALVTIWFPNGAYQSWQWSW